MSDHHSEPVTSPDDSSLDDLCDRLAENASSWQTVDQWPAQALKWCADAGVYRWFVSTDDGGLGWSSRDQTRGYLRLAESDLTTTFVITQYMGAIRRILGSNNPALIQRWAKKLIGGEAFGTVGISHLTTSRQHLNKPVLSAEENEAGFVLNGLAPWVTGAPHADVYVVGAALPDGRQLLTAVPRGATGVHPNGGIPLVALSASCTDSVQFQNVQVEKSMIIADPVANVMQTGIGARTGGLQTSTLAAGLARAAVKYLEKEALHRAPLKAAADELRAEAERLNTILLNAADGESACEASEIRTMSNRLALRSTQAAMTAAKGAGFVAGHPVGSWCQQAMFFLVWSCPQPVAQAHLCELAGIE